MSSVDQSVRGVALDSLFPSCRRTAVRGASVASCVTDWRAVQPGDAYVAVDDGEVDGHTFATKAVARGASAVICEQPVPVFQRPVYVVPDSRVALGQLCQALVGRPSEEVSAIGVAGTQGKTTVVALLQSILDRADFEAGVMSGQGCYDGMSHSGPIGEVPSPMDIAQKMAGMVAAGCTHAVAEVTSQSMSRMSWSGIEFDMAVFTNVTQAHLDVHNSVENYREAQRRLLGYLSPEGMAVFNADDPVCAKMTAEHFGPALTYGIDRPAEVTAEIIELHASEQFFVITAGSDSIAVRTTIVGRHHVYNCLAAATAALAMGIDLQSIAAGLEAVAGLPGRMERVDCGQGFAVFVDSASTLDGVRASLRTARQLAGGRVICVAGPEANSPGAKGEAFRRVLEKMADVAILAGKCHGLERRCDSLGVMEVAGDRTEAIERAVQIAQPGDVVVIAGSEPPTAFTFGGGDSEADLVRELLYARPQQRFGLVA